MSTPTPSGGPGLERSITLTDAVVAIAMTLLILPVVDVVNELDIADPVALWREASQPLSTFVISFLVIYAFWRAHGGLWQRLQNAGVGEVRGLGLANMVWLLLVALAPFPTALVGRTVTTVTAPLYIATMLALSAATYAMTVLVHRAIGCPARLAWLTMAVFALCLVVSLASPGLGLWLILLLFVTGRFEQRAADRPAARVSSG